MDGYVMNSKGPAPSATVDDVAYLSSQVGALAHLNLPDPIAPFQEIEHKHHTRQSSFSSMASDPNVADLQLGPDDYAGRFEDASPRAQSFEMGTAGSRRKIRKNDREKRRRQELNEKFDVLMDMLNMNSDKAEKFVVLTEAINQIQTLRIENNSIQREKLKLRTQLQHLVSQYQQAYPGNLPAELQNSVLMSEDATYTETTECSGFNPVHAHQFGFEHHDDGSFVAHLASGTVTVMSMTNDGVVQMGPGGGRSTVDLFMNGHNSNPGSAPAPDNQFDFWA
ncbi:BHLH domain-containing protein [Plasmodiophora brassicae]